MLTLRLTQVAQGADHHRIDLRLEGDGAPQAAVSNFKFEVSEQDREDVRWYLEDFLQYPLDPAPNIAARVEGRMAEIGRELFKGVFQSNDDARDLWAAVQPELNDARIEIVTGVEGATTLPWELLRDPKTDVALALRAQSFVRAHPEAAERPRLPQAGAGPIRILLVICRPGGRSDVPFRSVANRLLKGLSGAGQDVLCLEVLRPPTFEQLSRKLRDAKGRGEPYLVVHFDGHGTYGEGGPRAGAHGYLLFENSALKDNVQLIGGAALGSLVAETRVPVLVLNACRSAHADPPQEPTVAAGASDDSHAKVRALGSLAHEIMETGATAVVAMRYNVYVETAAQFMADFYGPLVQGYTVGEAVAVGRKQLAAQPLRSIAFDPRPLQDWPVPAVFEAAPLAVFPKQAGAPKLKITLGKAESAPERTALDRGLPARPDAGFFGRDETLLALDRAFDSQSIVLLHAWAGSGKTTTAAEFARWYSSTGGVEGPVLFTSFEQYKQLARVLDALGNVFQQRLEDEGVHWLALDDANRRAVALQVMKQIPILWIWDNLEPVAGFPTGTPSKWSGEEQNELAGFLRAARDTRAKFLLTSRRDEQGWLGGLPVRLQVSPMPFQERVQLARALAEKHGRRLTDVEDWRTLLEFTQGNPLTITVLVGQALRDGLRTRKQIDDFVGRLRAGEAKFQDEVREGRNRSLGASLSYGFESAFSETERKQLALLHLFQGFVNVDALGVMGHSGNEWRVPELRIRSQAISLLDRAAEIGLLTAHGGGYYSIHPALPWFFKKLFDEHYADSAERATLAFVEAFNYLGNCYWEKYQQGQREVVDTLRAEEANLLHARACARAHGWWGALMNTMQGLRNLYGHTGRQTEWARLVEEIVPDFVDPNTDGPLPGREEYWSGVSHYRVELLRQARQWTEAERIQRAVVEWDRQRASSALGLPQERLSPTQRNASRTLYVSLQTLGHIQRELGQPECVQSYQESFELTLRVGDRALAATTAYNLGTSYKNLPAIRDLSEAERWYRRGLELLAEKDRLGRANLVGQLGIVAHERFCEAQKAVRPKPELLKHFNDALRLCFEALDLTPQDAIPLLAARHNHLGNIYDAAGDLERALEHYRKNISYSEAAGLTYSAAQTRFAVARVLARRGRLADAKEYAGAALRGFQTFGDRAKDEVMRMLELIARIDQDLEKQKSKVRSQKPE